MFKRTWFFICIMFLLAGSVSSEEILTSQPGAEAAASSAKEQQFSDHLSQGILNLKEENYEEAVEDFKMAREDAPTSARAAYLLGIAYKRVQNYQEALPNLKASSVLQPPVREAVLELADALYQVGRNEEGLLAVEMAEREGVEAAQTAFLKGLILLKAGKNLEAVDSFKKAKEIDVKLATSADYQIGTANLQEGNLAEAREIFRDVIVRDPNSDIAHFAGQHIDAITRRLKEERAFKAEVGIQYLHDDNVLLKPSDSSAAEGITGEGDNAMVLTLRGEYAPKLKGPNSIKAQYSLYLNKHELLKSYDIQSHTVSLVPGRNLKDGQISIIASYNFTLVADERYLNTWSVSPDYSLTMTDSQIAQIFLRYQRKDFAGSPITAAEDRSGDDFAVGASWSYLLAEKKGLLNIRYESNREEAKGNNWKYAGNKAGLSLLYPLTEDLKFSMGGEAYLQSYEGSHTVFGKKRDDKTYSANAILSYTVYDNIEIQAQYGHTRGSSNIAVYDYSKNTVSAGLSVRF